MVRYLDERFNVWFCRNNACCVGTCRAREIEASGNCLQTDRYHQCCKYITGNDAMTQITIKYIGLRIHLNLGGLCYSVPS